MDSAIQVAPDHRVVAASDSERVDSSSVLMQLLLLSAQPVLIELSWWLSATTHVSRRGRPRFEPCKQWSLDYPMLPNAKPSLPRSSWLARLDKRRMQFPSFSRAFLIELSRGTSAYCLTVSTISLGYICPSTSLWMICVRQQLHLAVCQALEVKQVRHQCWVVP